MMMTFHIYENYFFYALLLLERILKCFWLGMGKVRQCHMT